MAFEGFDQCSVFAVPDVDLGVCSDCALLAQECESGGKKDKGVKGDPRTLTTANDQIIISPTKTAPYDKAALLLPKIPPDNIRRLNLDKINLVIRHINEHIFRIATYAKAGHFLLHHNAVFLLASQEIVDCYLNIGGDCDEALSVGGDGTVLYSLIDRPGVEPAAFGGPETELFLTVQGAGDEGGAIGGPCCCCHGLGVVIYG